MRSTAAMMTWLTVAAAIALACAMVVLTTLRSPVSGAVATFTATFDDVSGLTVGDDVRISGVQVGKVEAISLNVDKADVRFSVQRSHPLDTATAAAVRYQNLLGQRYVELIPPGHSSAALRDGGRIPLTQTIPSFDVSKLFNGFRPLFRNLDPAQFNQFGENVLRVIQGDQSGLTPMLRDLDTIATYALDRQELMTTLVRNLGELSAEISGKSGRVGDLVRTLNDVFGRFAANVEELRDAVDKWNPPMEQLVNLLSYAERVYDGATVPLYDLLARLNPAVPTIIAGLALVPSLVQGLHDTLVSDQLATPNFHCAQGEVHLPGIGDVSFAKQHLVVCQ